MVGDAAGSIMRKAIRTAMAERPGPVHITVPINVGAAEASDAEVVLPPMTAVAPMPELYCANGAVADPLAMLARARQPVALVGMAAVRAGAAPAIKSLAERAGLPVVVSPKAKGILAEDHPYFAGTIDMACNAFLWDFLGQSDLILAIGFDAVELIKSWRLKALVIHIDAVPNTDQIYPAEIELVGSIPAIVSHIAESYRGQAKWSEAAVRHHREKLAELYYAGRIAGRLNPTDVVDAVRKSLPRNTIITMDVGSHKILVGQGWPAFQPGSVLLSNGLSSMGFALPGAMAAKLLHRDRPVVCFTGDGGFAMVQGELQLASSLGLGLIVVVFADNSLNRIEIKQRAKQYASVGTRFAPTDIPKLAEAMGCHGARVDDGDRLARLVADAGKLDHPLVIEARIDPAQYNSQF